jgi:hypothetical protein
VLRAVGEVVTFLVLVVVELKVVAKLALAVTRDWSSMVGWVAVAASDCLLSSLVSASLGMHLVPEEVPDMVIAWLDLSWHCGTSSHQTIPVSELVGRIPTSRMIEVG